MSRLRIPALVFLAGVLAALAIGCGGSSKSACVVVDASHSTRFALPTYLEQLEEAVQDRAGAGEAVAAVVATGEPLVEANVETADFAGLDGNEKSGERNERIDEFLGGVEDGARAASARSAALAPGSGILAAISLVAKQGCGSVLALSDGLEAADVRMKVDDILGEDGRQELLDRLQQRGRLPDLSGVEVSFPFGGYLPQGTEISKARLAAVPQFWEAYAERAGASLSWRS
jgi:hypothetical protein